MFERQVEMATTQVGGNASCPSAQEKPSAGVQAREQRRAAAFAARRECDRFLQHQKTPEAKAYTQAFCRFVLGRAERPACPVNVPLLIVRQIDAFVAQHVPVAIAWTREDEAAYAAAEFEKLPPEEQARVKCLEEARERKAKHKWERVAEAELRRIQRDVERERWVRLEATWEQNTRETCPQCGGEHALIVTPATNSKQDYACTAPDCHYCGQRPGVDGETLPPSGGESGSR